VELRRARELIEGWLGSPVHEEVGRRGSRVSAEVPLLIELGGAVVRGSIDLLAEEPGAAPLVIDYKTDRLRGADPAELAERYSLQRGLYALAAAEATGAASVRVAYVFLERPADPVVSELGAEDLAAARAELEAEVEAIAAGRFEVTPTPDWQLCHDCPARRRLCPSPASPPGAARDEVAAA
jgi:hypothetical protein